MIVETRRLAALDMHGLHGSQRRRQIIRAEFWVGAIACAVLGVWSIIAGHGLGQVFGIWLVGIGCNYIPLVTSAQSLMRPGVLEDELRGVDIVREGRQVGVQQLWLAVPFVVAIAAVVRRTA